MLRLWYKRKRKRFKRFRTALVYKLQLTRQLRLLACFLSLKHKEIPGTLSGIEHFFKENIFYQPLYGRVLPGIKAQRLCLDRAEAIYHFLRPMGPATVLDAGCSFGYFSYYLAERNYHVHGIDFDPHCIETCRFLTRFNLKNQPVFTHCAFDLNYVLQIKPDQYDIVLMLSVLHHITSTKKLLYVQQMMQVLLDKVPIVIVELARYEEEVPFPWKNSLPPNPLAIFDTCTDIDIHPLGQFNTHLSATKRPLYAVVKKTILVNNHPYYINRYQFISHEDAHYYYRTFYDTENAFIKNYRMGSDHEISEENKIQIGNALIVYKHLPPNHYFPQLLDYEKTPTSIKMVISKLPGTTLRYQLQHNTAPFDICHIVHHLLKALKILLALNYYHNDIRPWNIMLYEDKVFLFDFGRVATDETEDSITALLWLIYQLHTDCCMNYLHETMKYPLATRPNLPLNQMDPAVAELTQKLLDAPSLSSLLMEIETN